MVYQPLNRQSKIEDCPTLNVAPEVCYPKNDPKWARLVDCTPEQDPCKLALTGLRKPNAQVKSESYTREGLTVGNVEVHEVCPSNYSEVYGQTDVGILVPADQFIRYVADRQDVAAVAAAQALVDSLARYYAQSQLTCFAWNTEVTVACPSSVNSSDLNTDLPQHEQTRTAGTDGQEMQEIIQVATEVERLAITDAPIHAYVVQMDLPSPNYFKIISYNPSTNLPVYEGPVVAALAYADNYGVDAADAVQTARALAYASLICEYENEQVELDCPLDPDGESATPTLGTSSVVVEQGQLSFRLINYAGSMTGTSLIPDQTGLPPLIDQAEALALSLLECVYINTLQTVECAPATSGGTSIPALGGTLLDPLSNEVPAGRFRTEVRFTEGDDLVFPTGADSVAELNSQARALANSTLRCLYGNTATAGSCPRDVTSVLCTTAVSNVTVADKTTLGIDGVDPLEVINCTVPLVSALTNSRVKTVRYLPLVEKSSPTDPSPISPNILNACLTTPAQETALQNAIALNCVGNTVSTDGTGAGWGVDTDKSYISSLEPNTFLEPSADNESTVAATAAYTLANSKASAWVAATSLCLWSNEEVESISCDPVLRVEGSTNIARTFRVERAGQVTCRGDFTSALSKLDAQRAAWAAALASRECIDQDVPNYPVQVECPPHTNTEVELEASSNQPLIPAGTFYAPTEFEATQLALNSACATRLCIWSNTEQESDICADLNGGVAPVMLGQPGIVEAGTIFAYQPTDDPNARALAMAEAMTMCTTNAQVAEAAGSGGGVDSGTDHPWKPYKSGSIYRIVPGTVDLRLPSNMNLTWTPSGTVTGRWFYLTVSMSQTGQASSLSYNQGASVPTTPLPSSDGSIPSSIYVPLFSYDAEDGEVTRFYISARTNLTSRVTIIDDCTTYSRNIIIE